MAGEFCPRCGAARIGAFRYCRACQYDFEAAAAPDIAPQVVVNATSDRQQLARTAMSIQTLQVASSIGGLVGAVLGGLGSAWVVFGAMADPGLAVIVPFTIAPIVGAIIGQRVALALLA